MSRFAGLPRSAMASLCTHSGESTKCRSAFQRAQARERRVAIHFDALWPSSWPARGHPSALLVLDTLAHLGARHSRPAAPWPQPAVLGAETLAILVSYNTTTTTTTTKAEYFPLAANRSRAFQSSQPTNPTRHPASQLPSHTTSLSCLGVVLKLQTGNPASTSFQLNKQAAAFDTFVYVCLHSSAQWASHKQQATIKR